MPLQTIPGQTGFIAGQYSSMDGRAIGKFTDSNHLSSLQRTDPADYDKKIISLYTQTSLYSNDFLQMIDKSTPYYIDSNNDSWQWQVSVPFQFAKIVAVPDATFTNATPGIDGQEFELVFDRAAFQKNDIITAHKMYGDSLMATSDPRPYNGRSFIQSFVLTTGGQTGSAQKRWLQEGIEYEQIDQATGEFDQDLGGLDKLGDWILMQESLSSGYGLEHTITKWADQRTLKDNEGRPLDIVTYGAYRRNEQGKMELTEVRWEPFVEQQMRKKMLELKVTRMIWGKGGSAQTRANNQNVKRICEGVYSKMRNHGNLVQYNRGDFSTAILRDVFGDLFYRRVAIGNRRVKLFTNEAGIRLFRQANKDDLLASGLTIIADSRFIKGSGQNMMVDYGFDMMFSMETGTVEVSHLTELDLPQTNAEFGQNKMSTPLFLVFDLTSPDGGLQNNIREVRQAGAPSMTWGYIDGRAHHLGFAASQGMSSSSKNPGYTLWMEDRADVFIEDLSRTVIIEEIPQF